MQGRLLLMQGYRYGQFFQNSENRLARSASSSSQSADVASYGASVRLAPRMTFFTSYAESFSPQTATDFAGRLFAPVTGKGWDLGPKFDLIEGRLSGTIVAFAIERSNVLQPDPDHPGFNTASGLDRSRGAGAARHLLDRLLDGEDVVIQPLHQNAGDVGRSE